jgi:hypothetical protein
VNALKRSDVSEQPLEFDPIVLGASDDDEDAVVNNVRLGSGTGITNFTNTIVKI